ncbi:DMT family transporter [Mycoplasmatota bacterium]|nr:DMT family transporter [Mycoplasmatota bacterium]
MKNYDCIIIGDDIYALTIALFLTRKMRNILLINQESPYKESTEKISVNYNEKDYVFNQHPNQLLTGLDTHGLTQAFLEDLGIEDAIEYEKMVYDYIVNKDGEQKSRLNSFNEFKIYLMRYYPKQIDQVKRFFNDFDRHYKNYKEQYMSLLHNDDYTLSSLMVEWGDQSLYDLLLSYFDDTKIINEFKTNDFINGLDMAKVSAYNFFANYFIGLKSGFYLVKTPVESFRKIILDKIKKSSKHSIIHTKVTNIVSNGKKIEYIEGKSGEKYSGKYYFVSDQPIEFYNDYFPDLEAHVKKLRQYYPYLEDTTVKRTVYILLEKHPSVYDISERLYFFDDHVFDHEKIIKIYNESYTETKKNQAGKILIEFTYDKNKGFNEENILDKFYHAFPKLKKDHLVLKYGKEKPYLGMLRDERLRKKLSINELIDYESLNHIAVYENLYVGGSFIRPESGLYGKLQQAIVTADKIEDNLYFKDEAEDYYYSNDEVMMMLRQNYDFSYFGKKETHINFHIGKSMYFLRMKGKNIVVHQGRYNYPDLSIYTTNDRLIDLIYKKEYYKDVIESDFFRYKGDDQILNAFLKAFNLDDRNDIEKENYMTLNHQKLATLLMNSLFFIVGISAFLANYLQGVYIYLPAFLLSGLLVGIKYRLVKKIYVLDLLMTIVYLILGGLSFIFDYVNVFYGDHLLLIPIVVILFTSVIFNKPFVMNYLKYDYTKEFVHTKLFLAITNGLSFIWGVIFLTILLGPFFTGERYVSVLYNFVFLGFFLSYYYPTMYVKTSIKKS